MWCFTFYRDGHYYLVPGKDINEAVKRLWAWYKTDGIFRAQLSCTGNRCEFTCKECKKLLEKEKKEVQS